MSLSGPQNPGPNRPFRFPPIADLPLPNGLRVLAVQVAGTPLLHLRLLMPAGACRNPIDRPGLANLAGVLLSRWPLGPDGRNARKAADQKGISLTSGAGWSHSFVETQSLASSFDDSLELMARTLGERSLPEALFSEVRQQHCQEIERLSQTARGRADRRLLRQLYPGTAFGFPLPGSVEGLGRLVPADVESFLREYRSPMGSCLIVVSPEPADNVLERLSRYLGDWTAGQATPPPPALPAAPTPRGLEIHLESFPEAGVAQLLVGQRCEARGVEEEAALDLFSLLLGGRLDSRLGLRLRETLGLTYSVTSRRLHRRGPQHLAVETSVAIRHAGTALREILAELERGQVEEMSREEVVEGVDYLTSTFPLGLQTLAGVAHLLEQIHEGGRAVDYVEAWLSELGRLPEGIYSSLLRSSLSGDSRVAVVTGPAESLSGQLRSLGEPFVHAEEDEEPAS